MVGVFFFPKKKKNSTILVDWFFALINMVNKLDDFMAFFGVFFPFWKDFPPFTLAFLT